MSQHDLRDTPVRRPTSTAWIPNLTAQRSMRANGPAFAKAEAWTNGRICAVSNLENVEPGGWTWHVSVSEDGRRAGRQAIRAVRRDFGMDAAEEDNHAPGKVLRCLWLEVDPSRRRGCVCVAEAPEVTEAGNDRYVWRER